MNSARLALVVVVALVVGACGGGGSAAKTGGSSQPTAATSGSSASTASEAAKPVAQWRDVLKALVQYGVLTLDVQPRKGGTDTIEQACDTIPIDATTGMDDPSSDGNLGGTLLVDTEVYVCDPNMDPNWVMFMDANKIYSLDTISDWDGEAGTWLVLDNPLGPTTVARFASNVFLTSTMPKDLVSGQIVDPTIASVQFSMVYQALLMQYDLNTDIQAENHLTAGDVTT